MENKNKNRNKHFVLNIFDKNNSIYSFWIKPIDDKYNQFQTEISISTSKIYANISILFDSFLFHQFITKKKQILFKYFIEFRLVPKEKKKSFKKS